MQPYINNVIICGAPKEGNAHSIMGHAAHKKKSKEAICGETDSSIHGEVSVVLTELVRRRVHEASLCNGKFTRHNLGGSARHELAGLSQSTWSSASLNTRAACSCLAAWQAYFHDSSDASPLTGTFCQGLFHENKWDEQQINSFNLHAKDTVIADLGLSYSIVGCNETEEFEAFFRVGWKELQRWNAGLSGRLWLDGLADSTRIFCNWDTEQFHMNLWYCLTAQDRQEGLWCCPHVALVSVSWPGVVNQETLASHPLLCVPHSQVLVRTLGDGWDGAGRLCALGMQLVAAVPSVHTDGKPCERMVVRTMRMPSKQASARAGLPEDLNVWSRMLATVGGHIGHTVAKCIVRSAGESAYDAYNEHLRTALLALRGTAWLGAIEALVHLLRHGAQRVADATPPLVRTSDGGGRPAHNDGDVPKVYEVQAFHLAPPPAPTQSPPPSSFLPPPSSLACRAPLPAPLPWHMLTGDDSVPPDIPHRQPAALAGGDRGNHQRSGGPDAAPPARPLPGCKWLRSAQSVRKVRTSKVVSPNYCTVRQWRQLYELIFV